MQQTLLVIPPWLFQGPLLIGWIVIGVAILAYMFFKQGANQETLGFIPVIVVAGLVIQFVLPYLMILGTNPDDPNGAPIPIGLAIRGYGVMMLLAMVSGVGVAIVRATQVGISAEKLISMAFWVIIFGIFGARLFYVLQYGEHFQADTFLERLRLMIDMTRGGLVFYGSSFGVIASVVVSYYYKFKFWQLADVLAPAFMIGLGIGRVGCLLNGCCFGGDCEVQWAAVRFPAGSPPYMRQLETGQLLGITTEPAVYDPLGRVVTGVASGSLGEELGVKDGEVIEIRHQGDRIFQDRIRHGLKIDSRVEIHSNSPPIKTLNIERFESEPLNRSLPIHPTQLYSAINGFLLCGILFFAFPYRRREGDVFVLLLIMYPITRFLLEYVRTDESAFDPFGWFTVSQWVSIGLVAMGLIILAAGRKRPIASTAESA